MNNELQICDGVWLTGQGEEIKVRVDKYGGIWCVNEISLNPKTARKWRINGHRYNDGNTSSLDLVKYIKPL